MNKYFISFLFILSVIITGYSNVFAYNESYADAAFTYFTTGLERYNAGDYEGAIVDLDESIMLNDKYAYAYNIRGSAKHRLKDFAGAIADYDKAIQLVPEYPSAYYNRSILRFMIKDNYGAISDINKAIELEPANELYYNWRNKINASFQ